MNDTPHSDLNYHIKLDRNGNWWHDGVMVTNRAIGMLFHQSVHRDGSGNYFLQINGDTALIEVEDTPYFVRGFDDGSRGADALSIMLSDGSTESLAPGTLWIDDEHVLRCRVKGGAYPARFARDCQFRFLHRFLAEEEGKFFLSIDGKRFTLG